MTCHTTWAGYTLGFNELQLDRNEQFEQSESGAIVADNQVRAFRHIGLLMKPPVVGVESAPPSVERVALVDPYDEDPKNSLDDRARSYLHVNCSVCHRFGGGGTALIDLRKDRKLKQTKLLFNPMLGGFNISDAQIVCPGDPSRSVLYYRMAKSGSGRMPHLGSTVIDSAGLNLLARWIVSLRDTEGSSADTPSSMEQVGAQNEALQTLQAGAAGTPATDAVQKLLSTTTGGIKLYAALEDGRISPSIRQVATTEAMKWAAEPVKDLFSRFAPQSGVAKLGTTPDASKILALQGDPFQGRKIFFETASGLCSRCHIVGGQGTDFGPDLSHIATKYSKADILDNILHPSKTIVPGMKLIS